ncbi:alpha/beta fold hydrolase [Phenylobacterium sp.]|uniref:alpha/beta fold hydrolase n=1 Tax=Phenylobacterium sp. TaxID=1871053 RepID=UPI0035B37DAE
MADDKAKGAAETYDDRPIHAEPGELPPEVQAPLAPFAGAEPPAPQWFKDAIAQEPERGFVTSLGTKIEMLTWGEVGKPGLLLAHGNSAHADWWSFIAPYLAQDYRVASMSLAGMGASDWRDSYSFTDFAEDAEAVARAAGLYEGGRKPVYIGHSFGGSQVFFAAASHPERMHAAILVDTGFGGPPPDSPEGKRLAQVRNIPTADRASRVYPTLEAALARFRFMPPQAAGNLFVADFIARRSLKRAPLEDGSGEGWTWRFDPNMWNKLDRSAMESIAGGERPHVSVPLAHVYGDRSAIISRRFTSQFPSPFPDDMLSIAIPDSAHHVMVDQPLALVAALRALLAVWPA